LLDPIDLLQLISTLLLLISSPVKSVVICVNISLIIGGSACLLSFAAQGYSAAKCSRMKDVYWWAVRVALHAGAS